MSAGSLRRDDRRAARLCRATFVALVEAADLRNRHDLSGGRSCDWTRHRRVLVERQMRARGRVVLDVALQDAAKPGCAQDDDVIEALSSHRSDEPFGVRVGVSRRVHRLRAMRDKRSESRIPSIPSMGMSSDGSTAGIRGVKIEFISTMTQGTSPGCRCRGPISSPRIRPWCSGPGGPISGTTISVASRIY